MMHNITKQNTFTPLVSIVMPILELTSSWHDALNSCLKQTYQNIEIIVVSFPNLDVEDLKKAYSSSTEKIIFCSPNEGSTISSLLNFAVSNMKGQYFSFILPTDVYVQDKIEKQISTLSNVQDYTIPVYGNWNEYNEDKKLLLANDFSQTYSRACLEKPLFMLIENVLNFSSMLIHKSIFEKIGCFDEALDYIFDYELLFRVFKQIDKLIYVNSSLVTSFSHSLDCGTIYPGQNDEVKALLTSFVDNLSEQEAKKSFGSYYQYLYRVSKIYLGYSFENYAYQKMTALSNPELPNPQEITDLHESILQLGGRKVRRICIYGLGFTGFNMFYELKHRGIDIDFFSDSNSSKWGMEFGGIKCISPQELQSESSDTLVIITVRYAIGEITKSLALLGINFIVVAQQVEKLLSDKPVYICDLPQAQHIDDIIDVDFAFVYEVKPRELENICLVAAKLQKEGYRVAFVNTWKSLENTSLKNKYRCQVLVISAGYNSDVINYFASHVVDFNYIINLQWEQIFTNGSLNNKSNDYYFTGSAKDILHLSWGKWNYERLTTYYHIPKENVAITGHLSLDFFRYKINTVDLSKEVFFKKFGLSKYEKVGLFISSFMNLDLPDNIIRQVNEAYNFDTYMENSTKSQLIILDWLQRYLKEHEDVAIVYRAHPAEKESDILYEFSMQNNNFFIISEMAIKPWINYCDLIFTWVSTSLIEVWAANKKCYLLRPYKLNYDDEIIIYNKARTIETYEQLIQEMNSSDVTFPISEDDIYYYYSISEISTYCRIADILKNCLSTDKKLNYQIKHRIANYKHTANQLQNILNFHESKAKINIDDYTQNMIARNYATDNEIFELVKRLAALQ